VAVSCAAQAPPHPERVDDAKAPAACHQALGQPLGRIGLARPRGAHDGQPVIQRRERQNAGDPVRSGRVFPRLAVRRRRRSAGPAAGQQAADRGLADAVAAGHVGGGAPAGQHLVGHRRPLLGRELGWAPARPPPGTHCRKTPGPGPLGHAWASACRRASHSRRCCPVLGRDGGKRLRQAAQARTGTGEVLHPAHHLGHGPTEAVQPRDDHDVARAQAREQAAECGMPAAVLRPGCSCTTCSQPASASARRCASASASSLQHARR